MRLVSHNSSHSRIDMAKKMIQQQASYVFDSAAAAENGDSTACSEGGGDGVQARVGDIAQAVTHDGYRGVWFRLGFHFEYGDKYSGGLGTYTANHQPMAQYVAEVDRTYFVYGGTPAVDQRKLIIFVSYYDHATGLLPRPVALYFDPSVDDPHDNACLHVDSRGYVWVFKSGRGRRRPGLIFRSCEPYELLEFEKVGVQEFTYPQIWQGEEGQEMFMLFTKYFPGTRYGPARHLFWKHSQGGRQWSEDHPLAEFGGHYQTSGRWQGPRGETKFATFFNYHPESQVDRRTNVYYAQTTNYGRTWTTASGEVLDLPLRQADNSALILPLLDQQHYMYTCDLNFDQHGHPVLLFIVSRSGEPGPAGSPREWVLMHWNGSDWERRVITQSDHNYDMGSLHIEGNVWRIVGPTGKAPQQWGTGGEMEMWLSYDAGQTWCRERALTADSAYNHSYARRPLDAHPDFAVFWADGDATEISCSRLYFSNRDGSRVYRLPYNMDEAFTAPERVR